MELGAQLFTLRNFIQCERDIAHSLQKVAEIGYKTVQVSGMGPIDPKRLREICDKLGLRIVLTHTPQDRILYETEKVIEEHRILGCQYIGLGAMSEKYRDPQWLDRFVYDFQEPARKIKEAGMLFMYHNHNFEFQKIGGKRIIETLMESFSKEEMGFTLDTYWVQAAGADVLEWIEKLWDRIPCVHLKDMDVRGFQQVMAPVMEGNLNFKAILAKLEEKGATKYLLVEQDTCEESPFVCLEKSYRNLAGLGYR
jgi:sugar phosphate isomerase/epimerase